MNVQTFPRPPKLEKIARHLQIKYKGHLIAETKEAYWALETHHPPSTFRILESPTTTASDVQRITFRPTA